MNRILPALLLFVLACTPLPANAQKSTHRIVFALTSGDSNDWHMTIGNIGNLLKEMPSAKIEVVAYGPGINFVKKGSTAEPDIRDLEQKHVRFVACHNSMVIHHLTPADLLEGVGIVPSGVVEVIAKQEQGWSYIKAGR